MRAGDPLIDGRGTHKNYSIKNNLRINRNN